MIGNHLLNHRLMQDHQQQLLSEGLKLQEARAATGKSRRRSARTAPRLRFLGRLLGSSKPAPLPDPAKPLVKPMSRRQLPPLMDLERAIIKRLSEDANRRSRRLAQSRAIGRFARSHTLWYEALFDPRSLRSLPDDFYKRSASAVARSWAAQFPYFREVSRERDVERLEPVAKDFLRILAEEEARLDLRGAC